MRYHRVRMQDGSMYFHYEQPDFEYQNPILKRMEGFIGINVHLSVQKVITAPDYDLLKLMSEIQNKDLNSEIHRTAFMSAMKDWSEHVKEIMLFPLADDMLLLLQTSKKKIHEKIAKRIKILNPLALEHFIFSAWEEHQFTHSTYRSESLSRSIAPKQMPTAAILQEGKKIVSTGNTTLTDGQIKMAIEQRNVIISKFIDKGEQWHCFFYTQNSILGNEHNGYKHIHYISHAWGYSREEVLKQLKSKRYNLPSITIPYDYRRDEE